jgi:hypothetical protein
MPGAADLDIGDAVKFIAYRGETVATQPDTKAKYPCSHLFSYLRTFPMYYLRLEARGSILIKTLRYKPEGRVFENR